MENKKKNKILKVLGLVGLFVLVFGLSYALFRITLTGRKKTRIKTANFKLELLDENNNSIEKNSNNEYEYEINIDNALPISDEEGTSGEGFIFKLRNSGNIGAKYTIYLDDVELQSGENRLGDQYIKYSLTKNDITPNPSLLSTLDNRKLDTGIIMNGNTFDYELKIWIDHDATIEASNKVFEGVLRVEAEQHVSKINIQSGTFADTLVKQGIVDSITQVGAGFDSSKETDGLYEYTDEGGTPTYVYRGINPNNYVTFAGSTWRVIRIQEDGTVKLIKEDFLNFESDLVQVHENDYKTVNYYYDSTTEDDPTDEHSKYITSTVKQYIDEWYSSEMTQYDNKIATNTYCSDRTEDQNSLGYKMSSSYVLKIYGVYNRFSVGDWDGEGQPTEEQYAEAAFIPSVSCRNEDEVNEKAALITADEYVLFGGSIESSNNYLVKSAGDWWTMSPFGAMIQGAFPVAFIVASDGILDGYPVPNGKAVRPVITLKANVTVASGNGTAETPYIIQ